MHSHDHQHRPPLRLRQLVGRSVDVALAAEVHVKTVQAVRQGHDQVTVHLERAKLSREAMLKLCKDLTRELERSSRGRQISLRVHGDDRLTMLWAQMLLRDRPRVEVSFTHLPSSTDQPSWRR